MANGLYIYGLSEIMKGHIDLINANISIALIDTSKYSVNLNIDQTLSDIDEDAIIAQEILSGKTVEGSSFNASDLTFESLESDQDIGAVLIFLDSESNDTSTLIAYFDSDDLPITPDGEDITINWNESGIFEL